MQKIENLNLLYGQITWDQVYLAMVLWALQLMGSKYQLLRQHIKLKLPSETKEILKEPNVSLLFSHVDSLIIVGDVLVNHLEQSSISCCPNAALQG